MKKLTTLLMALLLLATLALACGCFEQKKEYRHITLTKENYDEYIAINVELSDYNLIALDEPNSRNQCHYTASVLVHITTASKIPGLIFDDVQIEYNSFRSGLWETGAGIISPTGTLDYLGNSNCSFVAITEYRTIAAIVPSTFLSKKGIVISISGSVLVPQE